MGKRNACMRESGRMTRETGKVMNDLRTGMYISESSLLTSQTERASTLGRTGRSMTASGKEEEKMAMVCGEVSTGTAILENGRTAKQKDMEFIYGKMETNTKESSVIASSLDTGQTFLPMGTVSKALMQTASLRVSDSTNGRMEVSILETS